MDFIETEVDNVKAQVFPVLPYGEKVTSINPLPPLPTFSRVSLTIYYYTLYIHNNSKRDSLREERVSLDKVE